MGALQKKKKRKKEKKERKEKPKTQIDKQTKTWDMHETCEK